MRGMLALACVGLMACDAGLTSARAAEVITISALKETDITDRTVSIEIENISSAELSLLCAPEARIHNEGEWQEFEVAIWPSRGKATPLETIGSHQRRTITWTPRTELRHSETRYRIRCDARRFSNGNQENVQTVYTDPFRLVPRKEDKV